ncbi:hypothetical protein BJY52DRAFT_1228866 [Lactarius psammicola]|nr:hypothetical protein BJY52DRAFT_1228866 [Lactarius psammicola]
MNTIDHAEQTLWRCRQDERTLRRYNIAILRELCAKNGIEVDEGGSKRLKKPYIKALLSYQRQRGNKNIEQTGLKIRLPYFLPRINKKWTMDDAEDRSRKRQQDSKEPGAVQFAQPTTVEHLPMDVDTPDISHGTTPPVAPNSPRMDTAPALTGHLVHIPAANAAPISEPASQPSTTTIPNKRPYPFSRDEAKKKKKKTGGYINVRIYAERKDVDHTHEIQCALTPDGGLNLASLVDVIPIFGLGAHYLPKVLDARYSRPWVRKHPVLERGAIKLLKAKEGYLRVVGQAPSPVRDQEPSRFPSWRP